MHMTFTNKHIQRAPGWTPVFTGRHGEDYLQHTAVWEVPEAYGKGRGVQLELPRKSNSWTSLDRSCSCSSCCFIAHKIILLRLTRCWCFAWMGHICQWLIILRYTMKRNYPPTPPPNPTPTPCLSTHCQWGQLMRVKSKHNARLLMH